MDEQKTVVIERVRTLLRIYNPPCAHELEGALTCKKRIFLRGAEAAIKRRKVEIKYIPLFSWCEDTGAFRTYDGLLDRICEFYATRGYKVELYDVDPVPEYIADMQALSGHQLRSGQVKALAMILSHRCGQFDGITGLGKTTLFRTLIRVLCEPRCRLLFCARPAPVVNGIVRSLREVAGNNVGHIGGGKRQRDCRITVSTEKSLGHVKDPGKIAYLFHDEVHTAGTETTFEALAPFINAKKFGFSASPECRGDNTDLLVEAYYGPVRQSVDLLEGQREGYIPPVEAKFYRVAVASSDRSDTAWKREVMWGSPYWNSAVEAVAKYWERRLDSPQILIMTDTLEHVLILQGHLPDYEIIYRSADAKRIDDLRAAGIVPDDFVLMDNKRRDRLIRAFERGDLRRVISTPTLGTGVDAPGLDVIIRAGGGSSEIANIQYRGRVTRGESGVYCDFLPMGDVKAERDGSKRLESAKKAGWKMEVLNVPYE